MSSTMPRTRAGRAETILAKFRRRNREKKRSLEPPPKVLGSNERRVEDYYEVQGWIRNGMKLARDKKTGEKAAVEIVRKNEVIRGWFGNCGTLEGRTERSRKELRAELEALLNVRHDHIVGLFDVFEDEHNLYLITEVPGDKLLNHICKNHPDGYSEKHVSEMIPQMIAAVQHYNSKGFSHGDLNPENVLLSTQTDSSVVKISCAASIRRWQLYNIPNLDRMRRYMTEGSVGFVAPEILLNFGSGSLGCGGAEVDIWSLGVLLYKLLCGFCPFFDDNTPALYRAICQANYSFPSPYWDEISNDAKDLIGRMLVVNPRKRATAEEILSHPWIRANEHTKVITGITVMLGRFRDHAVWRYDSEDEEDEEDDDASAPGIVVRCPTTPVRVVNSQQPEKGGEDRATVDGSPPPGANSTSVRFQDPKGLGLLRL